MIDKIIEKIRDGIKHPIIYTALVAAVCKITQSLVYKKILHIEINGLVAVLPWVLFGLYSTLSLTSDLPETRKKMKPMIHKLLNPILWNIIIIVTTILSMAIPYFRQ